MEKYYVTLVSKDGKNFYPNEYCDYVSSMVFYPVLGFDGMGVNFIDDEGKPIFAVYNQPSSHLKDGDVFKLVTEEDIPRADD